MAKNKKKSKKQLFKDIVTTEGFKAYEFIDDKIVWNDPYTFPDEDKTFRPQCINHGCYDPVAIFRGVVGLSKGREIRTVCSACHLASYGKKTLREGIVQHKKDYCENQDGHLGFPCTSTIHGSWVLELDHIDGNHLHNLPSNVETLCKICHAQKSRLAGDYKKISMKHTSPHSPQSNISLQDDDSARISKTDPTPQMSNLCSVDIDLSEIQVTEEIQPTSPYVIS